MANLCLCIKIDKEFDEKTILTSLDSVVNHISSYVVCHNGRIPKTIKIIKQFFEDKCIPGTVNYCNLSDERTVLKFCIYYEYSWLWSLANILVGEPNYDNLDQDRYMLKYRDGSKKIAIYRSDSIYKKDHTYNTVEGDYHIETDSKLLNKQVYKQIPGYIFYPMLDSIGYDMKCLTNKTVDELGKSANDVPYCMGFNTLGWMKYRVRSDLKSLYGAKSSTDGIYVKDIEPQIKNLIKLLETSDKTDRSDITFVVTTCKRWDLFKETIDMLLLRCQDLSIIDEWICVDDNSSEQDRKKMQERYPFFRFIFKDESQKGHQKSLNMLLNEVKTEYIMHFEDDWFCRRNFSIGPLLDHVKKNSIGQLILRNISAVNHDEWGHVNNDIIYDYKYNPTHHLKPALNKEYDINIGHAHDMLLNNKNYWWWPGFSLNPGIAHIKRFKEEVGYFQEQDIKTELFEYDYALKAHLKNIPIQYTNLNIDHIGAVSGYSLNGIQRYYDQ